MNAHTSFQSRESSLEKENGPVPDDNFEQQLRDAMGPYMYVGDGNYGKVSALARKTVANANHAYAAYSDTITSKGPQDATDRAEQDYLAAEVACALVALWMSDADCRFVEWYAYEIAYNAALIKQLIELPSDYVEILARYYCPDILATVFETSPRQPRTRSRAGDAVKAYVAAEAAFLADCDATPGDVNAAEMESCAVMDAKEKDFLAATCESLTEVREKIDVVLGSEILKEHLMGSEDQFIQFLDRLVL